MTINQVELANTFNVWRIRTNQLIDISNDLKEGNLATTGTISLDNPSGFQDNVTLNVNSGMIAGDGGALSNVGAPGSITNQKLANSSISVTTSQNQVTLSQQTIALGDSVSLIVANLTTSNTDTAVANIASANLVNAVHKVATFTSGAATAAYNKANSANIVASNAYEVANSASSDASSAIAALTSYGVILNLLDANTDAAFAQANDSLRIANLAFDYANTRYSANGGTVYGNMRVDGDATVNGSMNITGSLVVSGNTYFIDSTTLNIADPIIFLAANNSFADVSDMGFVGRYKNTTSVVVHTGLIRDASSKEYFFFEEYSGDALFNDISTTSNNFTVSTLNANIKANNMSINAKNVETWIVSAYTKANNVSAGSIPPAKIGSTGDAPGKIAFSNNFVYFSMNTYNGVADVWKSVPLRDFEEPTPYLMMPYFFSTPSVGDAMFLNAAPFSYYLPNNLDGSLIVANTSPTTAGTLTLTKNGTTIGSINFAGGVSQAPQAATVTMAGPVSFVRGDVFGVVNGSATDMGYVAFSILGYRS